VRAERAAGRSKRAAASEGAAGRAGRAAAAPAQLVQRGHVHEAVGPMRARLAGAAPPRARKRTDATAGEARRSGAARGGGAELMAAQASAGSGAGTLRAPPSAPLERQHHRRNTSLTR
jgi:hypothetical protein